jgi:hypothetical protein
MKIILTVISMCLAFSACNSPDSNVSDSTPAAPGTTFTPPPDPSTFNWTMLGPSSGPSITCLGPFFIDSDQAVPADYQLLLSAENSSAMFFFSDNQCSTEDAITSVTLPAGSKESIPFYMGYNDPTDNGDVVDDSIILNVSPPGQDPLIFYTLLISDNS